jgi:Recombination endonuclease VII
MFNQLPHPNRGRAPWNKGQRGLQIAWHKGLRGFLSGPKNNRYKDGLSKNNYQGRKELLAGRPRPDTCEICRTMNLTDFDHDHLSGKFRGWICRRCNLVLGMVKDNARLLRLLADYLDLQSEETRPRTILNLYALQSNNSDKESRGATKED